jgi:hypothetical protein
MKNYRPPKIPTLAQAKNDRDFLRQLPARWKKSAAVLACAGMMLANGGHTASASESPEPSESPELSRRVENSRCSRCGEVKTWNISRITDGTRIVERRVAAKADAGDCPASRQFATLDSLDAQGIMFRAHYGGTGMASYVVHFTEAEALNIIRALLEAEGLDFSGEPPEYAAEAVATMPCWCGGLDGHWNAQWERHDAGEIPHPPVPRGQCGWCGGGATSSRTIGISLFDAENNIAIAQTGWSNRSFRFTPAMFLEEFARLSEESGSDITFGVFGTPEIGVGSGGSGIWIDGEMHQIHGAAAETNEALLRLRAGARPELTRWVENQTHQFIEQLREEGILP